MSCTPSHPASQEASGTEREAPSEARPQSESDEMILQTRPATVLQLMVEVEKARITPASRRLANSPGPTALRVASDLGPRRASMQETFINLTPVAARRLQSCPALVGRPQTPRGHASAPASQVRLRRVPRAIGST
jgi:hypothetical protein